MLGLSFVKPARDCDLETELWQLYREYESLFKMTTPFQPNDELIEEDAEEKTWKGLKLQCVESSAGTDFFTVDLRVRRLRSVPPQVTFNLPNLNVAGLAPPAGMEPAQFQDFVNTVLIPAIQTQIAAAAEAAALQLRKSMPQQGFEQIFTRSGWARHETDDIA